MKKVHNINLEDTFRLHQWLQGACFTFYDSNTVPVDGTDISISVVSIGRESIFTIDLSPKRSREGMSEGQKYLYHFEDESPIIFRQR